MTSSRAEEWMLIPVAGYFPSASLAERRHCHLKWKAGKGVSEISDQTFLRKVFKVTLMI